MWDYSEKVKDHFLNPRNAGELNDANAVGEVGSLSCGDALKLMLRIDEDQKITDARFLTFGCGSAIASSSALTELIIGRTVDEALALTNQDIAEYLDGLPPEKMHCSVMGAEALHAAIANFRGEEWVDDHEEGALICKCFGVDEAMIERAVEVNKLTTLEQVTHYTKAGGSCQSCHEAIEEVLERVMKAKGIAAEAPKPAAPAAPAAPNAGAMTNLQRMQTIMAAMEEMRPYLQADGGDVELVDIQDRNVHIRLSGTCVGCQMASVTVSGIQQKLMEKLGEPVRVIPAAAR